MSLRVQILPGTFHLGNPITGEIWLQNDEFSFPAEKWSDFPVVILGWWLANLQPLIAGLEKEAECSFMDGPFFFNVIVETDSDWRLQCIEGGFKKNVIQFELNVAPKQFLNEILSAARVVLDTCEKLSHESRDTRTLRDLWLSFSTGSKPLI